MRLYKCALLCALLALSIVEPITARKSFGGNRHSYPKSGGLSGGSHHSSSGGLSGGGHGYPSSGSHGSHGYPSSGGLSGGGHGYPSSGGSHSYPSSGSNHGYPSSGSNTGSHGYPASGGLSGSGSSNTHHTSSHGYPAGKAVSGNAGTTNVHHHYHYSPPQQISYAPHRGAAPVSYPVYHGSPPTYVYQYKNSGSKYGTLLAGLALLNLGTLAAGTAYAVSHSHSSGGSGHSYKSQPGEVCKFGLKKDNGDYEETRIDCQLISSFILQEEAKTENAVKNTTVVTTTVTNVTTVTNGAPEAAAPVNQTTTAVNPLYEMLPNGTLVPVNATSTNATENVTTEAPASTNNTMPSVTVTTINSTTTVTNALDVKGKPVDVTPGMKCYVIRNSPVSNMRKSVPCGLLQTYADKSLAKNSATYNAPAFTVLVAIFAASFIF